MMVYIFKNSNFSKCFMFRPRKLNWRMFCTDPTTRWGAPRVICTVGFSWKLDVGEFSACVLMKFFRCEFHRFAAPHCIPARLVGRYAYKAIPRRFQFCERAAGIAMRRFGCATANFSKCANVLRKYIISMLNLIARLVLLIGQH